MPKPFEIGNQEGTKRGPNKVSTKVKEAIVNFLENNVEKIQEDFDSLKPGQRLQFIADILPYAAPKLSSVTSENNNNHSGEIIVRWDKNLLPTTESPPQE